jgi:hypothetical protein
VVIKSIISNRLSFLLIPCFVVAVLRFQITNTAGEHVSDFALFDFANFDHFRVLTKLIIHIDIQVKSNFEDIVVKCSVVTIYSIGSKL